MMGLPFAICHWPLANDFAICNWPLAMGYLACVSRAACLFRPRSFVIPHPSLVTRHASLSFLLLLLCLPAYAQRSADQRPPPLDPAQAKAEAKALVAKLLAQRPDQNTTNNGQVRIRDRDGKEMEIPARFEVVCTPTNWMSIYELLGSAGGPAKEKLTVVHAGAQPNQYRLTEMVGTGQTSASTRQLAPSEIMVPFAGSDFWVADLGLEFLHWPQQRLLKKQMRHSKSCDVLESTNPAPGGYARVESWVTIEAPHGIVHADAYDAHNEPIKSFDPTNLEKINGAYQLAEMEMRNHKTDSHTWIKFDLSR
jgi:hypothetical protein